MWQRSRSFFLNQLLTPLGLSAGVPSSGKPYLTPLLAGSGTSPALSFPYADPDPSRLSLRTGLPFLE